ncbi:MAG: prepilin-type N-terminal cleavage/methylation domain-containing protein [Gemmatimonadetes bacterium]|nr:prepilin-type N-terminal cleavage/methylation domain-containing protein [Gemmatimonadota bacterium]
MLNRSDEGFALIELIVALLVLTVAILGVAGSASTMSIRANSADLRSQALQAVDDQISRISVDPRYGLMDSLYAGTDTVVAGLPGFSRVTAIDTVRVGLPSGDTIQFRRVKVSVAGPTLPDGVSRSVVLGAP